MLASEFAVDPDEAAVVGRTYVKEGALVGLLLVGEVALVPEGAFVVKEGVFLGVPVAGDFEGGRFAEVVLGVVLVLVEEVAVFAKFIVEGKEAGAVGIDDGVPIAVEADLLAVVDVDEERLVGSFVDLGLGQGRMLGPEEGGENGEREEGGMEESLSVTGNTHRYPLTSLWAETL